MFYPEFEKKIKSGEVMEGDLVWVTGYYHNDPLLKPTRHVRPTLAQVTKNTGTPISRSKSFDYHFRPCGKSGKLLAAVISPYDNIPFYTERGGSLGFFFTEDEAKSAYLKDAKAVKKEITEAYAIITANFQAKFAEVDKRIAEVQ